MAPPTLELPLTDITPCLDATRDMNEFALRALMEELSTAEHTRLEQLLGILLRDVHENKEDGTPKIHPYEYHHLTSNLTVMSLELAGLEDADERLLGSLKAMAEQLEGTRAQRLSRVASLVNYEHPTDIPREDGDVATLDRRWTTHTTAIRKLDLTLDLLAHAYPAGFDVLNTDPEPDDDFVTTLDANQPIYIAHADGTVTNEILLKPYVRRKETTVTWLNHGNRHIEPIQCTLDEDSGMLIGRARRLQRLYGARIRSAVILPTHVNTGPNPYANSIMVARTNGRIAILLNRVRSELMIIQGDHRWHYDPMSAIEDSYGFTEHWTKDEERDDELPDEAPKSEGE